MLNTKRAQISLESAVLIACIVSGLVAMRIYIARAIQGKFKQTADNIGEQYAPGKTDSAIIDTFSSDVTSSTKTTEANGTTTTTVDSWDTYIDPNTGLPIVDPNTGLPIKAPTTGQQSPETHTRSGTETVQP